MSVPLPLRFMPPLLPLLPLPLLLKVTQSDVTAFEHPSHLEVLLTALNPQPRAAQAGTSPVWGDSQLKPTTCSLIILHSLDFNTHWTL